MYPTRIREIIMALVNCKECGAKISEQADICPQCGAKQACIQAEFNTIETNKTYKMPQSKKKTKFWIIGGIIGIVFAIIIVYSVKQVIELGKEQSASFLNQLEQQAASEYYVNQGNYQYSQDASTNYYGEGDNYQMQSNEISELEGLVREIETNAYIDLNAVDSKYYKIVEIIATKMLNNEYSDNQLTYLAGLTERYEQNRTPEVAMNAEGIVNQVAMRALDNWANSL